MARQKGAARAGLADPRAEQASEHPAPQLEGFGEDQRCPVAVWRHAAPRPELLLRPEEVETRSKEAREPVAAPLAPLDPCEAARGRVTGTGRRVDVEDQRRAALVAS